ncbi:DUF3267 domain-containing protein [Collinsella sp. AGMB00827]|uniref:DUF3267 domain-containing protein n=1 Tax=Collinsella ureilytica TaxID=2869515 RepID=A0ABS7MLK8_9ACTN|nr:GNAT family N-acetyltransferase [Collinsella urealyticum]MBY4798258.1 DUF3267 domain-containing protein [Collinsella urealyticum]
MREERLDRPFMIRRAVPSDVVGVLSVLEDGRRSIARLGIDQWQDGYPGTPEAETDIACGSCIVAEDRRGTIVGTLALKLDADPDYEAAPIAWLPTPAGAPEVPYAAIHRCATAEHALGKGVMGALFSAAAELAQRAGKTSIRVDTHPGNIAMRAFLMRQGFLELEPFDLVSHGGGDPRRIAFERPISADQPDQARMLEQARVGLGSNAPRYPSAPVLMSTGGGHAGSFELRLTEDAVFLGRATAHSGVVALAGGLAGVLWFSVISELLELPVPTDATLLGAGVPFWALWIVGVLCAILCSYVLHELIHAALFKILAPSARVRLGASWSLGLIFASAEGVSYSRRRYQLIIMAPTVVITGLLVVLGVLTGYSLAAWVVAVIHLTGCTGDWGCFEAVIRDKAIVYCEDTAWGVRFHRAQEDAKEGGSH